MNEKEKSHFEIIKQVALGSDSCRGFGRIALTYDLDDDQLTTLADIFDKYAKKHDFHYSELEQEVKNYLGLDYQSMKGVIGTLYDDGRYIEVIKQYLKSNHEAHGNVSSEYDRIYQKLFNNQLKP